MNKVIAEKLAQFKTTLAYEQAVGEKDVAMGTNKKAAVRVTVEQKDKIIDLYKQGYNGVQIAHKIGVKPYVPQYHIDKFRKQGFKRPETTTTTTTTTPTKTATKKTATRTYTTDTTKYIAKLEAKVEVLTEMLERAITRK